MFSSGITTLNLAVTGDPDVFANPGNIISYIGDSDSGKTMLALTSMAASFYCKPCNLLFYDFEFAMQFNLELLFGKKFAKTLTVVQDRDMTIEDWQKDIRQRFKASRKPLIVTTDSTDALKCKADIDASDELSKGSSKAGYGTGNASAYSRALPEISKSVSMNKGLLILLSQVRVPVGNIFGPKLCRSGGKALNFHSDHMIWLAASNKERIDKIKVGGWTKIDVQRNKLNGETRTIFAPIYPQYGIDDTRSMLHFLVECEKAEWATKDMKKITVGEKTDTLAKMAAFYDTEGNRDVLKRMVVEAWNEREEKLTNAVLVDRPPRFG